MAITILPVCCGCEEALALHTAPDGCLYCDDCADGFMPIAPPDEAEERDFFGRRVSIYDARRDALEEESLNVDF